MIGLVNFTEGEAYQIQDGYFLLIGITDSTLLFTNMSTSDNGVRVPISEVRKQIELLLTRLEIEEECKNSDEPCGRQDCGECHPENFETVHTEEGAVL